MNWLQKFWSEIPAKIILICVPLTGLLSLPLTYFQDGVIDYTWFWITSGLIVFYLFLAWALRNWK